MSIQFVCRHCSKSMKAPDSLSGKKGKCPRCGSIVDIPLVVRDAEEVPEHFDDVLDKEYYRSSKSVPPPIPTPAQQFPEISVDDSTRSRRSSYGQSSRSIKSTRSQNLIRLVGFFTAAMYGLCIISATMQFADRTSQSPSLTGMLLMVIFGPLVITAGFVFYFAPTMISYTRDHSNTLPIMIINIVFGWTLLGWVGALAWACSSDLKESRQHIRQVIVHEQSDE